MYFQNNYDSRETLYVPNSIMTSFLYSMTAFPRSYLNLHFKHFSNVAFEVFEINTYLIL